MMRGVFVLSLSTLRPLPPSAPTRRAKAKRRRAPEARRRNATPVQRLWRRACQRAGHWALWQWSPAPGARRRAPRSAYDHFYRSKPSVNRSKEGAEADSITDLLKLGCLHLKIRPQWLKFKKMLVLQPIPAYMRLSVGCLFLRSPSRVPYRTELIPRAPKGRCTRTPHP